MSPILWIRVKIGYTQLSLTFFHEYRPNRPIYHKIKKIIFSKKTCFFWSKICLKMARTDSIAKPRQSQVRMNIPNKRTIMDFSYHNINFSAFFHTASKNGHFAMNHRTHKWNSTHPGWLNRVNFDLLFAHLNVQNVKYGYWMMYLIILDEQNSICGFGDSQQNGHFWRLC